MTDIPTTLPLAVYGQRPRWPIVVGTISIVIASIGLVCTPIGMLAGMFGRRMCQSSDINLPPYNILFAVTKVIISVLLLVAGINLVSRRRSARMLHLVWAVIKIPAVLIGMIVAYSVICPANQTSQSLAKFAFLVIIPMTIGVIIALAWPVFVLIWFNRTKIKQQVAQW